MHMRAPKLPRPTTVDFETHPILDRPYYPPEPAGVSIKEWGKPPRYYAWGHIDKNGIVKPEHNIKGDLSKARAALAKAYRNPDGVLFMNAKFDLEVAHRKLGMEIPPWEKIHDLMFLIFLRNPNERTIGLKESAARHLNMPPDERDAVADWLATNQPLQELGIKIGRSPNGKEPPGKYIAYAPADVVGPYANGDTIRTEALFRELWPYVAERGMLPAYDREREFMLCIMDMEARGIRVDTERLAKDVERYSEVQKTVEAWICKRLGVKTAPVAKPPLPGERKKKAPKPFNLDSAANLLDAMVAAGVADTEAMGYTKTGRVRTNKAAMAAGVADAQLRAVLQYRAQLKTCLGTFMRPWLETAGQSGGLIYTTWNQVKQEGAGARTGRMSSSNPVNFQNMPKEFQPIFRHEKTADMLPEEVRRLPLCPIRGLPPLPLCRAYIIPFEGHVLVDRDYSQQEPRILAHFEKGEMQKQYGTTPWIDFHDHAKERLEVALRRKLRRKTVKAINLGIIYGMGLAKLAEMNNETVAATRLVRDALLGLYPGLEKLTNEMRHHKVNGTPLRTWGDREYYAEPDYVVMAMSPEFGVEVEVDRIDFTYKMVNTLIQGSAADCTKEAVIRYYRKKPKTHFLILQVHDQLVASVPRAALARAHKIMREAMESVEFRVKILTEGEFSYENWNAMQPYDKKGVIVAQMKEAA